MKHEDLFNEYQDKLKWIDRRLTPDCLEFYKDTAESWKHAKEVAFQMYQRLRYLCEDGIPTQDCFKYSNDLGIKALTSDDGIEYPCIGILSYRGHEFPIYNDDYGMSEFIVVNDYTVAVADFGGAPDWYYMVDKILDKIS